MRSANTWRGKIPLQTGRTRKWSGSSVLDPAAVKQQYGMNIRARLSRGQKTCGDAPGFFFQGALMISLMYSSASSASLRFWSTACSLANSRNRAASSGSPPLPSAALATASYVRSGK